MNNFFNNDDLIIFIDDEICPNDERILFSDLPENIVAQVANDLELLESEYNTETIESINKLLKSNGKQSIKDYMPLSKEQLFDPKIYEPAVLKLYHPSEINNDITTILDENKKKRIFIVLDQYLDNNSNFTILKKFLSQISKYISENYIGIVFYTSAPVQITTLDESINYLQHTVGLNEEEIKNLSIYVNFINKTDGSCLKLFELAFRRAQNSNLLSLYKSSYTESIKKLQEATWNINHNEDLIHYDYLMEGAHLDDIFYEIYTNILHKTYHKKCLDDYEKYINPVRKATLKYEENNKHLKNDADIKKTIFITRSLKTLNSMHKKESYLSKCKKSDDIKFGDVFKIDSSYYMVITQDCDLSTRLNSTRKVNSINLIEIKYSDKTLSCSDILNKLSYLYCRNDKWTNLAPHKKEEMKSLLEANVNKFENLGIRIMEIFNKNEHIAQELELIDYKIEATNNLKIFSIEDIFLDSITVKPPSDSHENIIITGETINNSKEIRLATKICINKCLEDFLQKYKNFETRTLKNISNTDVISNLIQIEFSFDESENLNGFIINNNNLSRIGNLNYIKAHDILKEFMSRYSRYSYSVPTNL